MIRKTEESCEYEISDSVVESIRGELILIDSLTDDEVCEEFYVDDREEAITRVIEFWHDVTAGTGMLYDDFLEELRERNVI